MFDQTPSLQIHAALASLLGGLFGVVLILVTHSAQAQTLPSPTGTLIALTTLDSGLSRLGETAAQALRRVEPVYSLGSPGLRLAPTGAAANASSSGLRWQVTRLPGWRSEGDIPRSRDVVSLGLQVRF